MVLGFVASGICLYKHLPPLALLKIFVYTIFPTMHCEKYLLNVMMHCENIFRIKNQSKSTITKIASVNILFLRFPRQITSCWQKLFWTVFLTIWWGLIFQLIVSWSWSPPPTPHPLPEQEAPPSPPPGAGQEKGAPQGGEKSDNKSVPIYFSFFPHIGTDPDMAQRLCVRAVFAHT